MIEKIIKILRDNVEELADEVIGPSTPLVEGGYIDSFDIINLISALERDFDVSISLKSLDLSDFEMPESIVSFIARIGV